MTPGNRILSVLFSALLLPVVFTAPASAALIGLSSPVVGSQSHVYTIDPATGLATQQATLSPGAGSAVGLTGLGQTLYASDIFIDAPASFGTVNRVTGTYAPVNNQGGSANWQGLGANQSASLIYTIDIDDSNRLKSVTPTGVITPIGSGDTANDGRGLAYDDGNGVLYSIALNGNLYTVNVTTGASTLVGPTGISTFMIFAGLAYDEVADVLYANVSSTFAPSSLYTIDVTTGAATLVGPNGATNPIDGLAWIDVVPGEVPEPASIALIALAFVLLSVLRRRSSVLVRIR
jgi:hypothetical protein